MLIIGLTGSIAMGKSTVAKMFKDNGIPVISADDIVHSLYEGAATPLVEAAFPGSTKDNIVDRTALSDILQNSPDGFKKLEALIHPLVREEEWQFIKNHHQLDTAIVVIEIPLLYETGADALMDYVVLASADEKTQRARALDRPNMTEEKFELILSKQMPDSEKRQKSDHIINTACTMEETDRAVNELINSLKNLEVKANPSAFQRWETQMATIQ